MKRIILAITAVLISITLSYAESCSSGEGSLSYQISGCGEQSRACCGGNWCSWGVTSCASCTDTYTYNDYNCVGNVSNACAGTYRQHYNRSVTDNCGGCSYSGWNHYDTSNWCSYYQSCDRQYTSNTYYGNCGSGSLTYYYYKDASNTCASCTYGDWVHYSSSGDGRQWLQSCDSRQYTSSGDSSGACSGEIRYYYYRDLTNSCNSCDYGSWVHYNTSDSRQYTQSCSATGDSTACSNVSSSYCSGTATRSVTGTCGGCSYSGWNTGSCVSTQSCTDTSRACSSLNSMYTSGTATRNVIGNCGTCEYDNWDTSACECSGSWVVRTTKSNGPFDYTTTGSTASGCPTCRGPVIGKRCGIRCSTRSGLTTCTSLGLCTCGGTSSYTVQTLNNITVLTGSCPGTTDCASYVTADLCASTGGLILSGSVPSDGARGSLPSTVPSQCKILRFNGTDNNPHFGLCTRTGSCTSGTKTVGNATLNWTTFTGNCKYCQ